MAGPGRAPRAQVMIGRIVKDPTGGHVAAGLVMAAALALIMTAGLAAHREAWLSLALTPILTGGATALGARFIGGVSSPAPERWGWFYVFGPALVYLMAAALALRADALAQHIWIPIGLGASVGGVFGLAWRRRVVDPATP